jgi:tetrahydromethanopterin S-methyltransferase subunit G
VIIGGYVMNNEEKILDMLCNLAEGQHRIDQRLDKVDQRLDKIEGDIKYMWEDIQLLGRQIDKINKEYLPKYS